jgi:hypothetical protein
MDALLRHAYSLSPDVPTLKQLVCQAELEIFKRYSELSTPDDWEELQRLSAATKEVLTIQIDKLGYPKP